jgi:hypothetical protein
MIERTTTVDGTRWIASISGRITMYDKDELSIIFSRRDEHGTTTRRVSRFSPQGSKRRNEALAELSDAEMVTLFRQSQTDWTSPELDYARG